MQSPKNRLIEYANKFKVDHPVFNTTRIGGQDHNPIFKSNLYFLGVTHESSGYGKKQAEFNVCNQFLDNVTLESNDSNFLPEWIIQKEQLFTLTKQFFQVWLYDGDNLQKIPDSDPYILKVIVASNHNSVLNRFKRYKKLDNVWLILCSVNGQDAADHYLTFLYGGLKCLYPKVSFKIFSDDHFAAIVEQF